MAAGISLANKCQLLFGFAVIVILIGVLAVPWNILGSLIANSQVDTARQLADAWLHERLTRDDGPLDRRELVIEPIPLEVEEPSDDAADGATDDELPAEVPPVLRLRVLEFDDIDMTPPEDDAVRDEAARRARTAFEESPDRHEWSDEAVINDRVVYRYARAIREAQWDALRNPDLATPASVRDHVDAAAPIRALLLIERTSDNAAGQLLNSKIFLIASGMVGVLLSLIVFTLILTKVIFSPVRRLRQTAEKVEHGDLSTRSTIQTGDEFEQLSEAFNAMLDRVELSQEQLQRMNENLDLKVDELSQANVGLFESNRFKSEFLANISHELRTPLNSIIGFAELLDDVARADEAADPKRRKYLTNILTSGRALLEMINALLDMAKIEAGRMDVSIEPTSVGDLVEGLANIMRPQADAKAIEVVVEIGGQVPMIETDPGKLQQVLYNFMSNAIKFTPRGGRVTISADRITRQDNTLGVRLAVADTGPGVPEDMQDLIFEKFRQGDSSHTRAHAGTGLGLAICRELAELLNAEVSFVSEPGRGATFFVDVPQHHQPERPRALMDI